MAGGAATGVTDPWVLLPPAELVARVVTGPPPHIPLASLAHLLEPRYDHRDELVDWALHGSVIGAIAEAPEDDPVRHVMSTYLTWRSSWRRDWPIGPISNVASLRDEVAEIDHDLDRQLGPLLHRVVLTGGTGMPLTAGGAANLLHELETVRLALSVDHRSGWGIVDDMPARSRSIGLARAWAPPREEVTLAATPDAAVIVRPVEGLTFAYTRNDGDDAMTVFPSIEAVDMRHDAVVVLDAGGRSLRLPLARCRPLGWLVPRSLRWHVRPVPIVVVWANLFHGLGEALRTVSTSGGWVEITAEATIA